MNITIKGDKEAMAYLAELPKKVAKVVFSESSDFMKDVYSNILVMVPRDTGFLASQINITNDGSKTITIDTGDAYYGIFQELGFTGHTIPVGYIGQHQLSPNTPGAYTLPPFAYVSKNTPFIEPAFNAAISQLNPRLDMALTRAIS